MKLCLSKRKKISNTKYNRKAIRKISGFFNEDHPSFDQRMESIRNKKGFICDLNGVIIDTNKGLMPGVGEFINYLNREGKRVLFMVNDSRYSRAELSTKMSGFGIEIPPEYFYTGAIAVGAFLRGQKENASAYVIGSANLKKKLLSFGITETNISPDYVIFGERDYYSSDDIDIACNLVRQGAKLIGTNPETSYRSEFSMVSPSSGAFISIIERTTNKTAYFTGKPNPLFLRNALNILNLHTHEVALIGNRMDHDIKAGIEANIETVLITPSKTLSNKWGWLPYVVLDSVGKIVN